MSPLQAGQTVLRYRILDEIGAGGTDEVFMAGDPKLRRAVAIKRLPVAASRDNTAW